MNGMGEEILEEGVGPLAPSILPTPARLDMQNASGARGDAFPAARPIFCCSHDTEARARRGGGAS